MRKILTALLGLLISVPAFSATEGYKDIKFGMTAEQVQKTKFCQSKWQAATSEIYVCDSYPFFSGNTTAAVNFIDKKVHSISLVMDPKIAKELIENLHKKYGNPFSMKEVSLNSMPDMSKNWSIVFDQNKVILDYNLKTGLMLHYANREVKYLIDDL